ncbi:hypothetical protein GF373_00745 [bacterium]|nr:hypothetical protein [bacterium]
MRYFTGLRLCILLVFSLLALSGISQTVIKGEVSKGQEKPMMLILKPIAKEAVSDQEAVIEELYKLFEFDLSFSGAFRVTTENAPAAYLKKQDEIAGTVDFKEWERLKVDNRPVVYLVKTYLVPRGAGLYELDVLVYDIAQGVRKIGTAYGADPHPAFNRKLLRTAGHQATADIIQTLSDIEPITQTRLAFVNYNKTKRTKEIHLIDYDGWKESLTQLTYFNSVTIQPDWSPDGKKLSYVSFKDSQAADCFIQEVATGKVTPFAHFVGTNQTPRWYPSGKQLALSLSAEGNFEVYRMGLDEKKPKRLTFNPAIDEGPDVSPTGNQIAFISDRIGSPKVYVMDQDGTNQRRIVFLDRKCDTPMWSPVPVQYQTESESDYRIAFCGFYSSLQSDIFTVRPDGSDPRMLTDEKGDNQHPSWSPNGQYIAFASTRTGKSEIYIMSSDPDRLLPNGERFYRVTYVGGENLSPSWSPN